MGTIRQGANGGFSGKAGSVIGSSWKDINYIKGLPKISNKAKTQKQLEQQGKFATAVAFLQPVKDLLNITFSNQKSGKASGYNMALKHVLDNAVIGIYPDYTIDYTAALFSKGSVAAPIAPAATSDEGSLVVSWSPDINPYNAFADDKVTELVYDPLNNVYLSGASNVLRPAGEMTVAVPAAYLVNEVHAFNFVMQPGLLYQNVILHHHKKRDL